MTTEQLAEAYDDGWSMAVFATMPEGMNGEAQILRAVKLQPGDNPYRDGPRPARLTGDRAVVAYELAVAVDGGTEDLATWAGVVDALVEAGALRDFPADSGATLIAAIEALLDQPVVHVATGRPEYDAFVSVADLRAALGGHWRGRCGDRGGRP